MIEKPLYKTTNKRFESESQGASIVQNRHFGLFLCVNHIQSCHCNLFPIDL